MIHLIKKLAYVFLYLPLLFAPHSSGIDFADATRINKMSTWVAVLVCIIGSILVAAAVACVCLLL